MDRFEQIIAIRRALREAQKFSETKKAMAGLEDSCWPGYEAIGTKELDGKTVPNCVPIKASVVKEGFPIPSPEGSEAKDVYIARCNAAISDEYGYEQANAICYAKWDEK